MPVKRFATPFALDPLTKPQIREIVARGHKLIKIRDDGWEIQVELNHVSQVTTEIAYHPGSDHSAYQMAVVIDEAAHVYRWADDGALEFCSLIQTGEDVEIDEDTMWEDPALAGVTVDLSKVGQG